MFFWRRIIFVDFFSWDKDVKYFNHMWIHLFKIWFDWFYFDWFRSEQSNGKTFFEMELYLGIRVLTLKNGVSFIWNRKESKYPKFASLRYISSDNFHRLRMSSMVLFGGNLVTFRSENQVSFSYFIWICFNIPERLLYFF